jgi:tRNA nucleotidyltransferase (CCA-adding enzyme)
VKIYLVGGAVRDQLLGLPVKERDWVVEGATPQEMLALGFRRVVADFPVFLHPETGEEYALARTEVKTGPGYKGFKVDAGPEVTLAQDLLRRDLTINALAQDEAGNLIDLHGGREDLDNGLLRHITPAFSEDPVRLLRIARFAAKLGQWGFRVAHGTHGLMKQMAASPDLAHLKAERVWQEMSRAMAEAQPWRFFEVLHRCGALARLIPAVDRSMGETAAHGETAASELVNCLQRAVALSDDPIVRMGVTLFHAAAEQADLEAWLKSVRAGRDEALLIKDLLHLRDGLKACEQATDWLNLAARFKPMQQPQRFLRFLPAAKSLWPDTQTEWQVELSLAVDISSHKPPQTLYQGGLQGKALGDALQAWRQVQFSERLAALTGEDGSC